MKDGHFTKDEHFIERLNGIVLIVATGLIHLIRVPDHFEIALYLGWLFIANFLGSIVAAVGIYRGTVWGWGCWG